MLYRHIIRWRLSNELCPTAVILGGPSIELGDERRRWPADCVVEAKGRWDGRVLERCYCEIKTGDASFERAQVEAMQELAKEERVLKIRVVIDSLPDQYSVRIHEVESAGQDG